ncbi:MAG: hypothetical protein K2N80_03740 [Lachnospiraceae bacterium]|nr:hypothetical protein [Lachnospiraceae bacterium]
MEQKTGRRPEWSAMKKRVILFSLIAGSIVGMLMRLLFIFKIAEWTGIKQYMKELSQVQNVFDEMMANDAAALQYSANIWNIKNERPHFRYLRMEYKNVEGNISSDVFIPFGSRSGLYVDAPLYISFVPHDEEGNELAVISFAYYQKVRKLYIYSRYSVDVEEPLSWEELESYKDYLLHDVVIGSYLDNGWSRFSMDDLGDFEIIDYLMPYAYCGMPDREVDRTEVDEHGVSYIIWLKTDSMLCIQQEIQHDDRRVWGTRLEHPLMLTDEIFGRDAGASRFAVQIDGRDCGLADLIEVNDDFIEWVKYSGQAVGNLQRISLDRETGCGETQQMLQNFPEEKMQAVLEHCEFYIEPGYLHVRFPYWDYESEEPAFVMNGNDLWRGWLTMRADDMERFLKVEKW